MGFWCVQIPMLQHWEMDYMRANERRCVQQLEQLVVFYEICWNGILSMRMMSLCPSRLEITFVWIKYKSLFEFQAPLWPCVQWLLHNQIQPPKMSSDPFELDEFVGILVLDEPFQINVSSVSWNQRHPSIQHQPYHAPSSSKNFWHHSIRALRRSALL